MVTLISQRKITTYLAIPHQFMCTYEILKNKQLLGKFCKNFTFPFVNKGASSKAKCTVTVLA